jgi:hypothetical protein
VATGVPPSSPKRGERREATGKARRVRLAAPEGPERSGGPASCGLRPAAAGLEGSAAHHAPQQALKANSPPVSGGEHRHALRRAKRQGIDAASRDAVRRLGSRERGARKARGRPHRPRYPVDRGLRPGRLTPRFTSTRGPNGTVAGKTNLGRVHSVPQPASRPTDGPNSVGATQRASPSSPWPMNAPVTTTPFRSPPAPGGLS